MITQNNNPKGFSLVELSVSLIVISLLTASFAPVITKKLSKNNITVGSFGGTSSGGGGASLECDGITDCILCKDNICYTCIKDKETCASGTYLDNSTCSCKPCANIISGCSACTKSGTCTSSTACKAFGDNCIQCNTAECEQCRTGYNLNEAKNSCVADSVECNDENCASCSTAEKCDVCNGGYDVEDGECTKAKLVDYTFVDSSEKNIKTTATALAQSGNEWKIKITGSGTIKFTKLYSLVDVFVVGAGGKGHNDGGGGGGGFTKTEYNVVLDLNTGYPITIGQSNSAASSGFGLWAKGGTAGRGGSGVGDGGGGGSGGAAYNSCTTATNGARGSSTHEYTGAYGQGRTTREFGEEASGTFAGEAKGKLYSAGGKGSGCGTSAGRANSGNGGTNANGGSGIVIVRGYGPLDENSESCKIRNCKTCKSGNSYACAQCEKGYTVSNNSCVVSAPVKYTYSGNTKETSSVLSMDGTKWKIKFTQSGSFTPSYISGTGSINVFAVGAGGTGGSNGGGGAGGYTVTGNSTIYKNNAYSITIGSSGAASSGFGTTASGGGNGASGSGQGKGGSGGTGGTGYQKCSRASNGNNGNSGKYGGGSGQGTTTREFGESSGWLYSYGGVPNACGKIVEDYNTGNGGSNGAGGSGIVIIRGEY